MEILFSLLVATRTGVLRAWLLVCPECSIALTQGIRVETRGLRDARMYTCKHGLNLPGYPDLPPFCVDASDLAHGYLCGQARCLRIPPPSDMRRTFRRGPGTLTLRPARGARQRP